MKSKQKRPPRIQGPTTAWKPGARWPRRPSWTSPGRAARSRGPAMLGLPGAPRHAARSPSLAARCPRLCRGATSASAPRARRRPSSMVAPAGAGNDETHHVGGVRREGRRPALALRMCRRPPTPSTSTWKPIGPTCRRACALAARGGCWENMAAPWLVL